MSEFRENLKVELGNMQDIPVEDNTERDYQKWLKARNKRVIENPKWENARKRMEGEER